MGMPNTPATNETLELELVEPPAAARWFGGGGCVFERDGLSHVFVRGTLVGSFGPKDTATRNLLMVSLAQGTEVHLEQLAKAFDYTADGLRRIRRLYEAEGGRAVMQRVHGGSTSKVTREVRERLHKAFDGGASIKKAWEKVGKKAGLGRSVVGEVRKAWNEGRESRSTQVGVVTPPQLALLASPSEEGSATASPAEQSPVVGDGSPPTQENGAPPDITPPVVGDAGDGSSATQENGAPPITMSPVVAEASDASSTVEGRQRVTGIAVESASHVQHLGTWLLVAMVARLGFYETAWEAADGRVSTDALRIAMDAVVMALGVGQKCVEGVRRLATSTAAALMMATGMPSPTWTRRTLGRFATEEGGMKLHLGTAGKYLREAQASSSDAGPVFYVDNHLRPYTGQEIVRRGWRMQDKRVRPGTSDYYVHDEDGRPVMRMASPSHASLTEWLLPIAYLLRRALGDEETILLAFDRAGAFPKQMATLRKGGVEFVTYERRPYPKLPDTAFTDEVELGDETLRLCDTRKNLGKGRGRVRRIAVKMPDGHQLNLLANSKRAAVELLEVMRGRWRQENGFKHGVERWGINQLDGRQVQAYPPDTIIPNPARRRLDRAIRIARVREGDARADLAALARTGPNKAKRAAAQREVDEAVAEQVRLEALRPSTPPKAALRDTELVGDLVHHTVEYKLVLDTIRIACANAESELATMLAPKLPRAAEAKKVLANLFAAPGDIRIRQGTIDVCLSPAGTRPEQAALEAFLDDVNRLEFSMPGDQQARRLRFRTPRT